MLDNIWDYLNLWIRKKIKETFTTDSAGDTAFRVAGELTTTTNDANHEEILNFEIPVAGVEYEVILPTNVIRYTIHCRDNKKMNLAYISGETSTNYLTIYPGDTHDSSKLNYVLSKQLYLSSSSNNINVQMKVQRKI